MNDQRSTAYINLDILEKNLNLIRSRLSPGVKILSVVKADAYGHGAVQVSQRLELCHVDYLGVATTEEGMELRNGGIKSPILVMSGILADEEIADSSRHNLTSVVMDMQTLEKISSLGKPLNIHIKIDTGMGRLGFHPEELPAIIPVLAAGENIFVEGVMSHFSTSEKRDLYGLEQIDKFKGVLRYLRDHGVNPGLVHMGNSGALINYPEAHFDMVRVGISLYGSHPDMELSKRLPVKPVMEVISKIALIKEFPPRSFLSYGRTFVTEKNSRIAYIPVGYADGYPRSLSNKGYVVIRGRRCGVVGTVCMDWFLADITDLDGIQKGEKVLLLGDDEKTPVTADEVARLAGTIPYEILCKISRRVPRVYI